MNRAKASLIPAEFEQVIFLFVHLLTERGFMLKVVSLVFPTDINEFLANKLSPTQASNFLRIYACYSQIFSKPHTRIIRGTNLALTRG